MTTNDAEAIARIIDPSAFNPDAQTIGKPAYWEAKREWAVRTATAILSYLASRREAQEPALYQCELEDGRIEHFSAVFGEVLSSNGVRVVRRTPLYTAPPSPAPAGEVERLRGALNEIDALDPEEHTAGCSTDALRGLVLRMGEIARAALHGGRHD